MNNLNLDKQKCVSYSSVNIFAKDSPLIYFIHFVQLLGKERKKVGTTVYNSNDLVVLWDYLTFCPIFKLFTIKQIFDFDPYRKHQ